MKVLYIGHYQEGTGWSQAAIDYILALDSVGVDVVCRNIKLNDKSPSIPNRIVQLEQKPINGATICIQHVLPHYMDYNGRMKNIGLFVAETDSIRYTGWPARLNTMDEIWVPNREMVNTCKSSGITPPIKLVPHASDTAKFSGIYPEINLPINKDAFIFYFIGEFIRRKNISGLLQAFHTEFDRNENVGLLIKSNKPGLDANGSMNLLQETSQKVRDHLRYYHKDHFYHREIFITDHLPEDQLMAIHKRCNCFVMPSFGEAWSIPAFDAMGFGNLVVSNNVGGPADFLRRENGSSIGFMIENYKEPAFGADVVFHDLNTGRENWWRPSINSMKEKMRKAFELSSEEVEFKKKESITNSGRYSYKNIGKVMSYYLKGKVDENLEKAVQTIVGR